ncbi:MAG TPA: 7-carboxy-7-deazaguanine synthase QueE [Chitinophagales bacterium]|nr:7-carboxy-7-deazaguanine synthase QueE [Chitinophagales bacterium]
MKAPVNPTIALPVMEHFYTIQGEGFYQGSAAYFVRLGGCDVGCPWCDVKESWEAGKHPLISVDDIVAMVVASGAKICVITGGEPLMHNLDELTRVLHSKNVRTNIETSGAYPLSGEWDWICVSPKRFKLPLKECLAAANELKVVIAHRNDLRWAEQNAAGVSPQCRLFLQPEWDDAEEILPLMIDYVKNNQQWELSLQIHKYLNVP